MRLTIALVFFMLGYGMALSQRDAQSAPNIDEIVWAAYNEGKMYGSDDIGVQRLTQSDINRLIGE